jgi:hypothetical protein
VIRALLDGAADLDLATLPAGGAELAIDVGLGPAVAAVTRAAPPAGPSALVDRIQAADMMARWTTADFLETARTVLGAGRDVGCRPILLKGGATALRLYAEPHLRLMTDLDFLVAPEEGAALESQLRAAGFEQTSHKPEEMYDAHHHSMPFLDRQRNVFVELHTRLYPPTSRLAADERFSVNAIANDLTPLAVGQESALVMRDELQLIYSCTRWAETLKPRHGVFPMLDVALLLRQRGGALDWDRIGARVEGSWAATAMSVMLGYLARHELASAPAEVMRRWRGGVGGGHFIVDALLDRLITSFILDGRTPGVVLTAANLRTIWGTLLQPQSPWARLAFLVPHLAFPPDRADRFELGAVIRRGRSRFGPGPSGS